MSFTRKISLATLLLFLWSVPCIAGNLNRPRLISSSFGSEFNPSVSPDGRHLAYTSDISGNEDIWILDLKERKRWKVTANTSSDYAPCFFGNDRLVFVSTRASSGGEIYLSDLKGENIRKIIGGQGYFDSPAVSPDRKTVAYIHRNDNENIRIYFHNLESGYAAPGPVGLDPAFALSGERIVFVEVGNDVANPGRLALYDLQGDSIQNIETGSGVISNPVFYPDDRRIVFARYTTDSDEDGLVTRNDRAELMIYDLEDKSEVFRFYPGFFFGEPTVSTKEQIFAVSDKVDIYSLSSNGLAPPSADASKQMALCDSLLRHSITRNDSLIAAAACLSAYNHYPDTCIDYLFTAADLYGASGMTDLAFDILRPAVEGIDREIGALAAIKTARIKFSTFRTESESKAWYDAYRSAREIIEGDGLSLEIVKEAYLFGIEVSHLSGRLEESNSLIVEALLRFTGDDEIIANLEMWRLRNITAAYVGDPMDLVPLYIDYLDRFSQRPALLDTAISDLIELTEKLDVDIAIATLENIQTNYPRHRKLALSALYEQGERFLESNQMELAGWKYRAIINDFREYPVFRFLAFERLGDLASAESDLELAEAYFDSARCYLDHIQSYPARLSFQRKLSSLKTMQGNNAIDQDPHRAEVYFRQAISSDLESYQALWGLAKALAHSEGWSRWEDVSGIIADRNKKMYFTALKYITEYEVKRKTSSLKKARRLLLKAIEQDYRFSPPYLSLGYVDCLLEQGSKKARGLYEEAVEASLTGASLARGNPDLEAAFLLNAGEAFYGLGQYGMAYENYLRSMEIDSTMTMDPGAIPLLVKLGESAFQIDSLEEASVHYQELYLQAAAVSDGRAQAAHAAKLGVIYQSMGHYLKALEYYEAAFPYYSSENDYQMMANLMKGAAVCYAAFGEDALAAESARRALKHLGQAGDRKAAVEDRVKLIIWPFGIGIPTVRMEPMNYGGSIYPEGFSVAADRALLAGLARGVKTSLDAINTKKEILRIFSEGKEESKTGGIRNALGRAYFDMGYLDSAASTFQRGYRLSVKQDDYIKAYIELMNWAVAILSPAMDSSSESDMRDLTELKDESLRLYERIPPAYAPAKANLKNIAGVAEFKLNLIKMAMKPVETEYDFRGWIENIEAEADRYKSSFERSRYLFREGISEIAFGEDPGLAASLSLNEAVLSLAIGDEDGYRTAISRAVGEARLSGSEIIYARAIGMKGLCSEMDLGNRGELISESITSFESLPPGQLTLNQMPLIEKLYSEGIKIAFESGDSLSALGYLERWRSMALLNMLNLYSYDLSDNDLLMAYIKQAKRYQGELVGLGANQRRLEALGISGQIELKKIKERELELRSQLLDIKEKISDINPVVSSRLFADTPLPQIAIENISSEEICIVPCRCGEETMLWLCDSTGIETARHEPGKDSLRETITGKLEAKKVATIALGDASGDRLVNSIRSAYPGMDIKRCFSLAEAYGEKGHLPLKLDGMAVVRFDGAVISDSLMKRMGAVSLTPDSLLESGTTDRYGWLVFDGELYYDRENPFMSYWEYHRVSGSADSQSRFHIHDLFGISTVSFGAILLDFPDDAKALEKWAMLRVLFDTGLQTAIIIPGFADRSKTLELIEEFSENIKELSPLKSFCIARNALMETADSARTDPEYYGQSGWDPSERESRSIAWYKESLFAGYQAAVRGNWQKAVEYYSLARRQSETAGLSTDLVRSITERLVDGYINLEDYESALDAQMSLIEMVSQDTVVLIAEWQRYRQIASDDGQPDRAISALRTMLELASSTSDTLLMARFYLKLAESYYDQNEALMVFESAGKAIELSHGAGDSLILAAAFDIRGQAYLSSGSYRNAGEDIKSAISIYEAMGETDGEYATSLSLGEVYNKTGRYMSGRPVLKSALEYYKDADDAQKRHRCLNLLARNYLESWQPLAAREYIDMALKENADNLDALMLLSDLMQRRGLRDSAYEIGLRMLSIARKNRSSKYLSEAHHNLGDILYSMDNLDLAEDQYLLALEFQGRDSTVGPGFLMYKLAATRAEARYNQDSVFMQIRRESPDQFVRDLCSYRIGIGMLGNGNKKAAREIFVDIFGSDDSRTARYLKWRLLYNLALASDDGLYETFIIEADSVSRNYPPEPAFVRDKYILDTDLEDLYYAIADVKLEAGDIASAIDLYERGFCSKIAALHLSSGVFDDTETELIGDYLQLMERAPETSFRRIKADFLSGRARYKPLWGEPESSVESLRQNLSVSQGVMRYYERPSGMILFYIDGDTISYNIIDIDREEILKMVGRLPEMLKYQVQADSVLQEWYSVIISPFEDLMEKREQILLVPDGAFAQFPLEALKKPEGDYLAEMFSLTRSIHLPSKFPEEINRRLFPCFAHGGEGGGDMAMGIIGSLSEAVGDCLGSEDNFVRFSSDSYTAAGDLPKGAVLCYIEPTGFGGDSGWSLETLRARRDGYGGAIRTLWEIPDQALSHYYWVLLDNLRRAEGLGSSYRSATSYLYGHYRGVPYYWACSAPYSLN